MRILHRYQAKKFTQEKGKTRLSPCKGLLDIAAGRPLQGDKLSLLIQEKTPSLDIHGRRQAHAPTKNRHRHRCYSIEVATPFQVVVP